ncbi:nucleotidyltransferase family protein [Rhodobacteraceae bacterium]|nr:nucleotidyltransferase family protein [Paracoccaceae bacterium]
MTTVRSAMIFAAGFGTRMGELTANTPKPLVPLAGRPMIDYTIDLLYAAGITQIVANVHYLAEQMAAHVETRGVTVAHEADCILDTGGGLRAALPLLGDGPVITINPDVFWHGTNPISFLMSEWKSSMTSLLLLIPKERALGTDHVGDFMLDSTIIRREGPFLFSGAQILRTDDIDRISDDVFSLNAYWDLLARDNHLQGVAYPDTWCDIGTPRGLTQAEALIADV